MVRLQVAGGATSRSRASGWTLVKPRSATTVSTMRAAAPSDRAGRSPAGSASSRRSPSDRLAQLLLVGGVVEDVVHDLEGQAQVPRPIRVSRSMVASSARAETAGSAVAAENRCAVLRAAMSRLVLGGEVQPAQDVGPISSLHHFPAYVQQHVEDPEVLVGPPRPGTRPRQPVAQQHRHVVAVGALIDGEPCWVSASSMMSSTSEAVISSTCAPSGCRGRRSGSQPIMWPARISSAGRSFAALPGDIAAELVHDPHGGIEVAVKQVWTRLEIGLDALQDQVGVHGHSRPANGAKL